MLVGILIGFPLLLVSVIIAYLSLPWLAIMIGMQLEPNPPKPNIRYGEFPVTLAYEINGQRKEIKDTLICEYDGIGADEGRGKFRKWKERLASGNDIIILLKVNENKLIEFYPGSAEYYMGDGDIEKNDSLFPNTSLEMKIEMGTSISFILAEDLLQEYNIKLISWQPSQPIKNDFQ